jgi:hypothetical protein
MLLVVIRILILILVSSWTGPLLSLSWSWWALQLARSQTKRRNKVNCQGLYPDPSFNLYNTVLILLLSCSCSFSSSCHDLQCYRYNLGEPLSTVVLANAYPYCTRTVFHLSVIWSSGYFSVRFTWTWWQPRIRSRATTWSPTPTGTTIQCSQQHSARPMLT